MGLNAKRKRVKAYVDAISELILSNDWSREKAAELVKKTLEVSGVEPFRGASKPEDIYDKELISLFIVATKGLGIGRDYEDVFNKVFEKEMKYEEVIKALESDQPIERVRDTIKNVFSELSENDIARILRFAVTLYYLDFKPYEFVTKVIRRLNEALPEFSETIRRFTKFFVAVKLAEEISTGNVRTRVEKEIRKQVISLETGIPRSTPSDEYVAKVAEVTYEIPKATLHEIFAHKGNHGREREAAGSNG
ncbi:MAG: DUF2192 domain-containing protein [Desulfurococcales archaeon]|nr:DUF2192 domain-containing protein [Desulfurococcales archaeon]